MMRTSNTTPLMRVSATGGSVTAVTTLSPKQYAHVAPSFLPDGRRFLFSMLAGADTAGLYLGALDGSAPVTTDGATFTAGVPHALFDVEVPESIAPYPNDYAVTADGQRFLVNTVVDQPTRPALTVIANWTSEIRK